MADRILMLALSPTMETGTIAKWNKHEGDEIAEGDVLCEVETDKTTMEYESSLAGTLLKITAPGGAQVKVGDMIAIAGKKGENISTLLPHAAPEIGALNVVPKPLVSNSGDPHHQSDAQSTDNPESPHTHIHQVPASPLARSIAQEKGIDLKAIKGSGPGGRIVKRDLDPAPKPSQPPSAKLPLAAGDEIMAVSEKRKVIAQRLSSSFQTAPHYYIKVAVSAEVLLQERARINKAASEKISLNAFLVKYVAEALKRHPIVNASWQGDKILKHGSIDIALAVAQPDGLITPIVRDCAHKGIVDIDKELKILIEKARTNQLTPPEYSGGTFTITNLGMFGIREFTAIINPPEAAILAVGEIAQQAVADDSGAAVMKPFMILTLSCDHRILDGAVSAAFLKTLKELIEDPINLIL